MTENVLKPGWPGRGHDPTVSFSNVQWYMYHQRNTVYFAAFSGEDFDTARAQGFARALFHAAPQFAETEDGEAPVARVVSVETVESFEDFPDAWLDDGARTFDDPALPLFRMRIARLAVPDAAGRRSFVLMQSSHALAEGPDSAQLSRSRALPADAYEPRGLDLAMILASALSVVTVPMQLFAARIYNPHPEDVVSATRAYPRAMLARIARGMGIRQQALFLALVSFVVCGSGTPEGKRRVHMSSSALHDAAGYRYDPFIRMRLVFESFPNRPDFVAFAREVDKRLGNGPGRLSRFGSALNNANLALHRTLSRILPGLYWPGLFAFMPTDLMFSLVPPHHLVGPLAQGLLEPVYSGASMPGIDGCVVVPGRKWITFNFHMAPGLIERMDLMDALLETLGTEKRESDLETT